MDFKGDIVDTVVCLKENSDSTQFYKYSFVSEPSRLIQNSKSAYYPVEMSEMIEYILKMMLVMLLLFFLVSS